MPLPLTLPLTFILQNCITIKPSPADKIALTKGEVICMAVYAIWNNKGGVGKSYLTFQLAAEYARINQDKKVLVVDLCPQANSSSIFLGGIEKGEKILAEIHGKSPRKTISGYVEERIKSPHISPKCGGDYVTQISPWNDKIPENLFMIVGDEQLEMQSSRVSNATRPGPEDAWRSTHLWIRDLIEDVQRMWNDEDTCVFIDCNPSFSIYTELALIAADRLIIPFSADGSSKRAVKAVLSLVYGIRRQPGDPQSEFHLNAQRFKMARPGIYMYIGNRLTQMNQSSASAFKTVVNDIGGEIWKVWQTSPNLFCVHPGSAPAPTSQRTFKEMFQYEVNDANTASVVSGALGIPIATLTAGRKEFAGRRVTVNQSQLDKQAPNIMELVKNIE
jgi:chromosome partitioning protein